MTVSLTPITGVSGSGVSGSGVVYAASGGSYTSSSITWNPADKAAPVTLSGGNLVATATTGGNIQRASNTASSAGLKKYFEALITNAAGNYCAVGIASASHSISSYLGATASSGYGYHKGAILYPGATATSVDFTTGDVIGVLYDASAGGSSGVVSFTKNGIPVTPTLTGINTATIWKPTAGLYNTNDSITARFNPASWSYAPPAGYDSWFA